MSYPYITFNDEDDFDEAESLVYCFLRDIDPHTLTIYFPDIERQRKARKLLQREGFSSFNYSS